ncbi:MAG: flavin reductase, partial [Ruthenibacterium sp.]
IFSERTPLLTAGNRAACNTMTIGWGSLGTLWSLPICTVFVRPQRYTYEFMEKNDYFTVSVFEPALQKTLTSCGKRSGRDFDKVKENHLTVAYAEGDAPYFEEAELVFVCKKLYAGLLNPNDFTDTRLEAHYPQKDYHKMFVGEVVQVWKK